LYKFIGNKCYFYVEKDGEEYFDPFIPHFSEFMHRGKAHSSVAKDIVAIHRFWMYSLFFPNSSSHNSSYGWLGLSLRDWLSDYEDVLKKGFRVKMNCFNGDHSIKTKKDYFVSKPITNTGSEFGSLEKYFTYLQDKDVNPLYDLSDNEKLIIFSGEKDYRSLDLKEKHGKGSGYGLKAGRLARESLAEKVTVFGEFKKRNRGDKKDGLGRNEVFPYVLYDALLEIADDRSKLLYLLCGAASARLGQALSLTKFDIDMHNKRVYLVDPCSGRVPLTPGKQPLFEQKPRKELLGERGIDFSVGKYKKIGFKHPIPVVRSEIQYLFFIQEEYRNMFFDTYSRYRNKIRDDYPMVFQTNSRNPDNIWLRSGTAKSFNADIEKLKKMYPKYAKRLNLDNAYHSLRHMFGQFIANMAYLNSDRLNRDHVTVMPNLERRNTIELYRKFCANKMGQKSDAVDIYFNADIAVDSYIQKRILERHEFSSKMKEAIISLRDNNDDSLIEGEVS